MSSVIVHNWPGLSNAPPDFVYAFVKEAEARGWDADAGLSHIAHESKFETSAHNPHGTASGLIQMIDQSARKYAGVSAAKLRRMSHMEQLPGIINYFDIGKKLKGADFLLLGVSRNPSLIGAPDSRVLFPAGSIETEWNPTLVGPDGAITAGSIREHYRKWADANRGEEIEVRDVVRASMGPSSSLLPIALLISGAYYLAKKKRRK